MKISRVVMFLAVCGATASHVALLYAQEAQRPAAGPVVTIHAGRAQEFEISLDEVVLDWSRTPGAEARALGRHAKPVGNGRIVESGPLHARATFPAVAGIAALQAAAAAMRTANPGADAYLVMYVPGRPKTATTRRLLTREVGLLLDPGVDAEQAIAGLPVLAIRPVAGVAEGHVVDAGDPIAALNVAEALRKRPGVRNAYPLVKRTYIRR